MVTKVPLHAVMTVAGYISLVIFVFTKPHPAALFIPLGLFGFSMFIQHVEKDGG